MNWRGWLAGVAFAALATALPSCGGGGSTGGGGAVQSGQDVVQLQKDVNGLKALRDSLKTLLEKGTNSDVNLNTWLREVAEAVCQLEIKATQKGWALDPGKRYCQGNGGPGDKKPPPPFPPL